MNSLVIRNEATVNAGQNFSPDVIHFFSEFIEGGIDEAEFSNLLDMHIELSEEY